MWRSLLNLIFPLWCAGCGCWDTALCSRCRAAFSSRWIECSSQAPYLMLVGEDGDYPAFMTYCLGEYSSVRRRVIITWKNVTSAPLDRAMASVIPAVTPSLFPDAGGRISVIPAPSSPARTKRGMFVAGVIASEVARNNGWNEANVLRKAQRHWRADIERRIDTLLGRHRRGLRIEERAAKKRAVSCQSITGDVVLVDDVLTTGATLAGAARAVADAGGRVVGALVLASGKIRAECNGYHFVV